MNPEENQGRLASIGQKALELVGKPGEMIHDRRQIANRLEAIKAGRTGTIKPEPNLTNTQENIQINPAGALGSRIARNALLSAENQNTPDLTPRMEKITPQTPEEVTQKVLGSEDPLARTTQDIYNSLLSQQMQVGRNPTASERAVLMEQAQKKAAELAEKWKKPEVPEKVEREQYEELTKRINQLGKRFNNRKERYKLSRIKKEISLDEQYILFNIVTGRLTGDQESERALYARINKMVGEVEEAYKEDKPPTRQIPQNRTNQLPQTPTTVAQLNERIAQAQQQATVNQPEQPAPVVEPQPAPIETAQAENQTDKVLLEQDYLDLNTRFWELHHKFVTDKNFDGLVKLTGFDPGRLLLFASNPDNPRNRDFYKNVLNKLNQASEGTTVEEVVNSVNTPAINNAEDVLQPAGTNQGVSEPEKLDQEVGKAVKEPALNQESSKAEATKNEVPQDQKKGSLLESLIAKDEKNDQDQNIEAETQQQIYNRLLNDRAEVMVTLQRISRKARDENQFRNLRVAVEAMYKDALRLSNEELKAHELATLSNLYISLLPPVQIAA